MSKQQEHPLRDIHTNSHHENRFEYVRLFEQPDNLLRETWIVVRNAAAVSVMKDLPDLIIAYGVSDEYRFVVFFFWTMSHTDMTIVLCSILIAIYLRGEARTYPS